MLKEYSKTEIIYKQLDDAYKTMFECRRVPIKFNNLFELYLIKSQQLTDTMRKEYKVSTGQSWKASSFSGWNEYTQIIKNLRNKVVHGEPLVLYDAIISIFPPVEFASDEEAPVLYGKKYKFRVMWQEMMGSHPFYKDRTPMLVGMPLKKPKSEKFNDKFVVPLKEFFTYSFPHSLLMECFPNHLLIQDRKCKDAIYLMTRVHCVFKNYFNFYQSCLSEDSYRRVGEAPQ